MPQIIGFIIVGFQVSFATGIGAIFTALGPAFLQIGLSIGLSLVSALFAPKPPKPEDVQGNIRQALPARVRLYGRGLLGGAWAFGATHNGSFHKVIAVHSGKLSAVNDVWVDDNIVEINPSTGLVAAEPYQNSLRIEYRLGEATETYYDKLEDEFPEWTDEHRGDGVASLYAKQYAVDQKAISKLFPSLHNTLYRMDVNGVAVYDPTDEAQSIDTPATWTYSDNLAREVMDYLWHRDGMRMPLSMITTPLALAGWQQAVNDCNDAITLKAGGTEPRYRGWVPYQFGERPADVLRRMMDAGNARFKPTSDGGLTLEVGKWRAPEVTIDDDCILSFDNVGRGKDALQTANVINATFTSADHQFQAVDADPWYDDADVSERGEIATDINAICSPSHGQTRRLMKIAAYRANPEWVGSFVLNKRGLKAFGERFINLNYALLGISGTFEVMDFKFIFGEHSTIVGASITVQSMPSAAFDWDAAAEEGTPPPMDDIPEDGDLPGLGSFTAELVVKTVSGVPFPYARLTWEAAEIGLRVEVRGRKTTDTAWTTIYDGFEESTIDWLLTEDGATYEFEARYNSSLSQGDWIDSTPPTLVAAADTVPPQALSSFTVTGGALHLGHAPLAFVTVSDTHLNRIAIYRAPKGVTLNKTTHFAFRIGAAPASSFGFVDGDSTPTNLFTTPDFSATGAWTLGTGWAIGAGVASKTGSAQGAIVQSFTVAIGSVYRFAADVTIASGHIVARMGGGGGQDGLAPRTTTGKLLDKITGASGNTTIGFRADATGAPGATIDNAVYYIETAACAPQGDWDYYAIPENISGVEGPQSGPLNIIIV